MSEIISTKNKHVTAFIKDELQPDEKMVMGIGCLAAKSKMKAFIATTKRALIYSKGSFLTGATYESINLDKIGSVEIENKSGTTRGFQLTLHTSANDISAHCIDGFGLDMDGGKSKSHLYRKALTDAIEATQPVSNHLPSGVVVDVADQLKKFAELHSSGVLTDEEFTTAKTNLLKL